MKFQTPIANTDIYKGSFFPLTIRDWNALPDSLISSAEDAEDCVAKFTSLVRAPKETENIICLMIKYGDTLRVTTRHLSAFFSVRNFNNNCG